MEGRGLRASGLEGRDDGMCLFSLASGHLDEECELLTGCDQPDTTREPGPSNHAASYLQYNVRPFFLSRISLLNLWKENANEE